MTTALIDLRPATPEDSDALAEIHSTAWLGAYRGLLNGVELQRLVSRRTAPWWRAALSRGVQIKLLQVADEPAGYATFGTCRIRDLSSEGEIYELYLRPEYQGLGFGRSLFNSVRAELAARNLSGLAVQVLSDNDPACTFYKTMGGRLAGKSWYRSAGKRMGLSVYTWPDLT
ncbi:GNAT family N-acetyltransferase [uncultured Roseibium sp.]|uniref:GNAT family N-acetyltransferase n=1 Tax=uncultured Roseibium sp. TaxID=1936171 RepID=UPI0032170F70